MIKMSPSTLHGSNARTNQEIISKTHAEVGSFTPLVYVGALHTRSLCPSRRTRYFTTCFMAMEHGRWPQNDFYDQRISAVVIQHVAAAGRVGLCV